MLSVQCRLLALIHVIKVKLFVLRGKSETFCVKRNSQEFQDKSIIDDDFNVFISKLCSKL